MSCIIHVHSHVEIITFLLRYRIMNHLQFVGSFLSKIENWPTKIIKFLFLDEPTAETVFEVSAYF